MIGLVWFSDYPSIHHYPSLSIIIHHYPSLSIIIHHYPSLSIIIHHYVLLLLLLLRQDPELRPDSPADDGQLGVEHAEIPAGLMLPEDLTHSHIIFLFLIYIDTYYYHYSL